MRQRAVPMALVTAAMAFPAAASGRQYILNHPKREHCGAHYVKKVERVKVHGRKVKETGCVYVAPKAATPTAPTPLPTTTSAPTPSQGTTGGEAVIYGLIFVPSSVNCEWCSPPAPVPPPGSVSDPGFVSVTNASTGAQVEEQKVAAGSAGFRVLVPAGAYVLGAIDEALPPTAYCPHHTITVAEGQQVNLNLDC